MANTHIFHYKDYASQRLINAYFRVHIYSWLIGVCAVYSGGILKYIYEHILLIQKTDKIIFLSIK